MCRFVLVSIAFFAWLLVLATPARAAPSAPSAADAKLAEALFNSGKEAMAKNDLPTACARFNESLKLDRAVGTLLNLAACEEKSGKLVLALEHFKEGGEKLAKDDFRVPFTSEKIATLQRRVARLVVKPVATTPPGTRVTNDGVEIPPSAWSTPISVDPGMHAVVIEVPNRPLQRADYVFAEGEERVIELRAADAAPMAPPPPASPPTVVEKTDTPPAAPHDDPGATRRTLAFVAGGIGVAGLATGAVTGLMAINAASTYEAHCTDGVCDPEGLDAAATGRTVSVVSPVAFVIGALGGGAAIYLFATAPSKSARGPRVIPTASGAGGGLIVTGAF